MAKLTVPILVRWEEIKDMLAKSDIVEVVRCRNCRFFDNTTDFTYCKRVAWVGMDEDDYCSFGERRES